MQHADPIALSSVLEEAKQLVEQLLAAPRCAISDIPTSQGAYLIFDKDEDIIYVGKGKYLKRRICDDHRGGDEKMSTSTFRRSVNKPHGIAPGRPLRTGFATIAHSRTSQFPILIYARRSRPSLFDCFDDKAANF